MSEVEKYKDYSWIKVKRAVTKQVKDTWITDEGLNEGFEPEEYVINSHHIAETTFLIEEVRKLAKEIDRLRGEKK